jgi:hypothetical protein
VVAGVPGRGRNLVFLARGDVINAALGKTPSDRTNIAFPANGGGIVSLTGSTGEVAWYIVFNRMPREIDCTLLDVTNDGAEDCIILGSGKLLAAVNPIPGNIFLVLKFRQPFSERFHSILIFCALVCATVLAESSYSIYFHQALLVPAMSTDVSQVGVALFPSF